MADYNISRCILCGAPVRIVRRKDGAADHYETVKAETLEPPSISEELEDFLRASRKGKKTVAIVGSGWGTRAWAPYQQKDTEVWCLNTMHSILGVGRATRWFEMHPQWLVLTSPDHTKWLQEDHDFPIYMLQEFDAIPNSVRYPLKEIRDKLLTRVTRDEENIKSVFSSTLCYMVALALYEGFERIELFGIELLMTDEWAYQREGLSFWLGRAEGMGVEVWIPKSCALFGLPLYGYDQVRMAGGGAFPANQHLRVDEAIIRGIREGQTAVVIGNGPSLSTVPREFLEQYPTFGVNHINLLPFQPTYYVMVDPYILGNMADQVYDVSAGAEIVFLTNLFMFAPIPETERLFALPNAFVCIPETFVFPGELTWSGGTSVYVALKLAYYMGFQTVLLVGVDCGGKHFSEDYPVNALIDKNNESPPKGMREHLELANQIYKSAGRRIVNLSAPSELDEVIERGAIQDWMPRP